MPQAAVIIPARFASTRLPGKPLLAETGKPLICHVVDRAAEAARADAVLVATDDARIAEAVRARGGQVVMTRADHPNGTSRIAEAADAMPAGFDLIVNVQGDEPEIDPGLIDRLIDRLRRTEEPMATVIAPFAADEDPANPNVVKAVIDRHGRALYFSRALIPHRRDPDAATPTSAGSDAPAGPPFKHLGIYAYRRAFLRTYVQLPPSPAEQLEQLEQLRVLEHGHPIGCILTHHAAQGIDTRPQYDAFVARHRAERDRA